jgi:ABC-type polysaccharide/polyol phosphate export permease
VGDSGHFPHRLAFAALGLIVCALAPSYDFFMYYFTLFITPMLLVSGVFFPADQLPAIVHAVASWLPLSHAVGWRDDIRRCCFATGLTRRRLLK